MNGGERMDSGETLFIEERESLEVDESPFCNGGRKWTFTSS